MRFRNRLWSVLVAIAATACSAGPDNRVPEPFVCTAERCPEGSCKLRLTFTEACAQEFQVAEVLLNDALEPEPARPGETFVSTGDTPVGETGVFWVRSKRWQWGPIEFRCTDPAQDGRFDLACIAAPSGPRDGAATGGNAGGR